MDFFDHTYIHDNNKNRNLSNNINSSNRIAKILLLTNLLTLLFLFIAIHLILKSIDSIPRNFFTNLLQDISPEIIGSTLTLLIGFVSLLIFRRSLDGIFETDIDKTNNYDLSELSKAINNFTSNNLGNAVTAQSFSRDDFYKKLINSVQNAQNEILLTSFYHSNPEISENRLQNQYFKIISDISKKPNIKINRLVSVPSKEKYEWVLKLIQDFSDVDDYNLRYIQFNEDDILEFPMPLNLQIIDKSEIFIINPLEGFYSKTGVYSKTKDGKSLYIKSEKLAEDIFLPCYYKLFENYNGTHSLLSFGKLNEKNINLFKGHFSKKWAS